MSLFKSYFRNLQAKTTFLNQKQLLDLLEINEDAKVLDIGCCNGQFTKEIAEKVGTNKICGLEVIEDLCQIAYREHGIEAVCASANDSLPFDDGSFDVVVANQLIEHLSETDRFIREICRYPRASPWHSITQASLDLNPGVLGTQRISAPSLLLSQLWIQNTPGTRLYFLSNTVY